MKTLLLLAAAGLLYCSSATNPAKVYICHSGSSYAYHSKICRALKNCSHKIDTVTLQQAFQTGHKKACGNCYK